MLEYLSHSLAYCYLQVSVVAVSGLAMTSVCLRYRPMIARTFAYTSMSMVATIVAFALVPIPTFLGLQARADVKHAALAQPSSKNEYVRPEQSPETDSRNHHESETSLLAAIDLQNSLVAFAQGLNKRRSLNRAWISACAMIFATLFVMGAIIGCVRFSVAAYGAAKVVRCSTKIDNRRVAGILREISSEQSEHENVALVESKLVSCASVIGWKTPCIVLPPEWKGWETDRLRAVLAHELAHVAANDFAWRTLSCFIAAINWANPFVALLLRRVTLCQELIADDAAGKAVGHRGYMATLSHLALELDTKRVSASTGIVPVFTGDLIRRIKMLMKTDFSRCSQRAPVLQTMGIAMLGLLCLTTFAGRGVAQDSERQKEQVRPPNRIAKLPAQAGSIEIDPTLHMFQRAPVDLTGHQPYETGFLCIRLADFFQLSEAESTGCLEVLNNIMSQYLSDALSTTDPMAADFAMVDRIEGSATMTSRYATPKKAGDDQASTKEANTASESTAQKDEPERRLMLGSGGVQLHFHQKVDCTDWARRYGDSDDLIRKGGLQVWRLPTLPAIGPVPMGIANRDDEIVCVSNMMIRDLPAGAIQAPSDVVVEMAEHIPSPNVAKWVPMYNRIAGGVATFVFTNDEIRTTPAEKLDPSDFADEVEMEMGMCFDHLLHTFETYALGIDISEDGRQLGVRFRIGYATQDQATEAYGHVRGFFEIARQKLQEAPTEEAGNPIDQVVQDCSVDFINHRFLEVQENDDQTADVYIAGVVDVPNPLGALLRLLIVEEAKYVAEVEAAKGNER